MLEKLNGFGGAAIFGFSDLYGGYAGGQAQYVRVPFANVGPLKIELDMPDEKVLFLSDAFPTGFMAAEACDVPNHPLVAVWGCGPVGQFAIRSAFLLGARKVFAIDRVPDRLRMAQDAGATVISPEDDVHNALKGLTGGRGPDACIDAVGLAAQGSAYEGVKHKLMSEFDRPYVVREMIVSCRKGGIISLAGTYGGLMDKVPMGPAFAKWLSFRMGLTHVHRYMRPLLRMIQDNRIDPSFVVTHRLPMSRAREAYIQFAERRDGCVKVVLDPAA
jgi:threonine dehydrogenase-like Zn-dependent dehydrogenase